MVWQLSHAWYGEVIRAQLAEKVGDAHAAELEIQYPELNPLTLPKGVEYNQLNNDELLSKVGGPYLSQGKGSNSWVISAERSASGCAVLCNDMHLALKLPSI